MLFIPTSHLAFCLFKTVLLLLARPLFFPFSHLDNKMPSELLLPAVAGASPRAPRQPKLRSSCDRCGAAKLKCDRGQPNCGRCLSLNQPCVYGVSRKTGKPPRDRLRLPDVSGISSTSTKPPQQPHPNTNHRERRDTASSHGTNTSTFSYDSIAPDSGHALDGQGLGLGMNLDALDTSHSDLFWPSMSNYPPLDFDDGLFSNMETGPYSLPTPVSESHHTTPRKQSYVEDHNGSFQPPSNTGHDCFREAYDVLGSLSLHRFPITHPTSRSPTPSSASTSTITNAANRVPLDHVLRLNREATERLGNLLTCPCAGFPQLTILYASIISQILVWYQQAAGCTQIATTCTKSTLWNPNTTDTRSDNTVPLSLNDSSPPSTSGSSISIPSPWSSTAASTLSTTSTSGGKNTPYPRDRKSVV